MGYVPDDVNRTHPNALRNPHLPLLVMMTCLNGYFVDPGSDALAESLLKAEGGGVAVWGRPA